MADLPEPGSAARAAASGANAPLAERLRPQTLDEVIGQRHLLGEGKPLRVAFESGEPHSMILWGPPGVGKTTLARLMAKGFKAEFLSISAVLAGVKEIREAVKLAEESRALGRSTILFVDEVHRFNKAQQDAFLPYVESGLFTFIGATTENPSFEVNGALLSRARVYVLQSLTPEELQQLVDRAITAFNEGHDEGARILIDADAQARLIGWADGDARRLLNAVEIVATSAQTQSLSTISGEFIANALSQNLRRFDKGGDQFYDQISALHKSVRGSNPDAALYWLVRMLDGGADPRYMARRMVRMASEDIGLADPRATDLAVNGADIYERLGSPEGELALAQAVVYMACAAQSNAVYNAYNAARAFVSKRSDAAGADPPAQRAHAADEGHGLRQGIPLRARRGRHGYAAGENYFPEGMPELGWYEPTERGMEIKIAAEAGAVAR